MSSPLINKGIVVFGDKSKSNCSRVVVVGTARGGTSLVAGVLEHLGVFMGNESTSPVYEDVELSRYFESGDLGAVKNLVESYTENHSVWGWKRPSSINYLGTVDKLLEKPSYIFVYKDVASIAQRNAISMLADVVTSMEKACQDYIKSIKFLSEHESYSLIVSYDKALSNPSIFVDSVIDFCGLSVTKEQREKAIVFISPNPEEYLEESRITRIKGRLDGLKGNVLSGWAKYTHPSMDKKIMVEIFLNDELQGTVEASKFRADLNAKHKSSCAFEYVFPDTVVLKKNDLLSVKAVGGIEDLNNSPIIIA